MMRRLAMVLILGTVLACGPAPPTGSTPQAGPTPTPTTGVEALSTLPATPQPEATWATTDIHLAEGAGKWYPADPVRLRAAVEAYVSQAEVEPLPGRLLAVIVPHAGYVYSGAVAGYAYRALREAGCADRTIAVIGDTHSGNGSAEIAVWAAGAFETPLGTILVDEAVAQAVVAADDRIRSDPMAFQAEHPVENQLPFIQVVCPGARIVPVVIRQPTLENAQVLAEALVAAFHRSQSERTALIVASTDLSHYHPYEEARRIDEVALQSIVSLDPQAVANSRQRCAELGVAGPLPSEGSDGPLTMCSQGAVMTALIAVRQMGTDAFPTGGTCQATVLYHATSGDTPIGEREHVVGYGAVALWQSQEGKIPSSGFALPPIPAAPAEPITLSPEEQGTLLTLARHSAAQFLTSESFPSFHTDDPALLQPLGAYVTYKKGGELRGCLGRLEGDRPAYLNVQYAAVAAALADPRFPPVTPAELESLTLEITLLQPMHQVQSPDPLKGTGEIQIGRDGVLMRVGKTDGALFLPQVAPEQGWDLPTTLLNLCRKAGLPDDCWQRPEARFYVFEGQWFGEDK